MIAEETYQINWIKNISSRIGKRGDPKILEKVIYAFILLVVSPVGMLYLSKIETGWIGSKIVIYVFIKTAIYTLFVISYIKEFNTKELRNIISLVFYIAVNINAVIIVALISGVKRRIIRDEDMAEINEYVEF